MKRAIVDGRIQSGDFRINDQQARISDLFAILKALVESPSHTVTFTGGNDLDRFFLNAFFKYFFFDQSSDVLKSDVLIASGSIPDVLELKDPEQEGNFDQIPYDEKLHIEGENLRKAQTFVSFFTHSDPMKTSQEHPNERILREFFQQFLSAMIKSGESDTNNQKMLEKFAKDVVSDMINYLTSPVSANHPARIALCSKDPDARENLKAELMESWSHGHPSSTHSYSVDVLSAGASARGASSSVSAQSVDFQFESQDAEDAYEFIKEKLNLISKGKRPSEMKKTGVAESKFDGILIGLFLEIKKSGKDEVNPEIVTILFTDQKLIFDAFDVIKRDINITLSTKKPLDLTVLTNLGERIGNVLKASAGLTKSDPQDSGRSSPSSAFLFAPSGSSSSGSSPKGSSFDLRTDAQTPR